jgi:hypothetical protein
MGSVNWDDLLKENRVVVLGEPGSGKSWEMKERARLLNSQGASAFYVRLDQLLERELSDVLDPNEQASLIRWKNGRDIAWFYLDSVDEAKFRRVSDFHSTLARFSKEFDSYQLLRTKVFLSSRISEWKPSTDRHEFQRLFPLPPFEKRTSEGQSTESQNLNPELLVVQMEPLDRNQVERFAAAKGVSDVTAFTEALDRAFAWEFARRPLDVVGLIEFWGANGTIGSLTQLIEFDVSSKLRPREGRDEFPLSEAEAREGAEWLAAASVFSRRFSFRVPDDGLPIAASLDPRACLPSHWRDEQIRALLNRAIFDSASYGNFRFHHRRVGEYLAARWITARMERGCPQFVLESILAEVVRGRKVLRPSMRSIAAWLCGGSERWNEMVRSIVIETDTGIHLRYGDPARLSLEYRRQILFSLSGLSKIRNRMWIESTPDCLARVADSGLSTDIKKMILDRGLAVDFRMELLEIVRHGRLKACADSALQVVASSDEPTDLKCYAVSAIGAIDNPELHEQLFHSVCQMPCIPRQLCSSLLQALYPRAISSEQLVQALAKTESIQEFTVNLPFYLKSHFETVVTPTGAGDLLKGLTSLAQSPPHVLRGQITLPVSSRFCWIAELIPTLLEILFRESTLSAEETATAAQSVRLLCHVHDFRHFVREDFDRLNRSILCHPEIRRSYLWHMAADFRMEHGKEPTTLMHLFDYWEVLRLSQDDFSWLLEDISGRTEFNDRLLALQLAIELWDASGRTLRNRWRLRRAVANDASLRAAFRQSIVASPLLPLKRFWWRNVRQKYLERWCWRRRFDAMLRRWYWLRAQTWLLCHLRFLGSGVELRWLSALAHEADEKNNSRWTRSTWSGLEKKRGKLITRATKRGCMAAWRGFRPELPHEKPNPSQTSIGEQLWRYS